MAAQRAFAASLLELPMREQMYIGGAEPALSDLLAETRFSELPEVGSPEAAAVRSDGLVRVACSHALEALMRLGPARVGGL